MRGGEAPPQVIELLDRSELRGVRFEAALGKPARVKIAKAGGR